MFVLSEGEKTFIFPNHRNEFPAWVHHARKREERHRGISPREDGSKLDKADWHECKQITYKLEWTTLVHPPIHVCSFCIWCCYQYPEYFSEYLYPSKINKMTAFSPVLPTATMVIILSLKRSPGEAVRIWCQRLFNRARPKPHPADFWKVEGKP